MQVCAPARQFPGRIDNNPVRGSNQPDQRLFGLTLPTRNTHSLRDVLFPSHPSSGILRGQFLFLIHTLKGRWPETHHEFNGVQNLS